jgi:hypothetical protein
MAVGAAVALASGAALLAGCGDDHPARRTITRCARPGGTIGAVAVGGELVCEDQVGTAYASRPLRDNETPETACGFCLRGTP